MKAAGRRDGKLKRDEAMIEKTIDKIEMRGDRNP